MCIRDRIRTYSPIRVVLQLAHAGRKASTRLPWEGGAQIAPDQPGGWKTVAPSPLPFHPGDDAPAALDHHGMARVREHFVPVSYTHLDVYKRQRDGIVAQVRCIEGRAVTVAQTLVVLRP